MRNLQSYVKKYGPIDGPKMFIRLQREAALASAHGRHKKAIAKKASRQTSPTDAARLPHIFISPHDRHF